MTLVHEALAPDVPLVQGLPMPRTIAVGVRDLPLDGPVLRWAATDALPGDALHVVHAYVPLRLDRCDWDPVRRERDHRAWAARQTAARATQRARMMRVDLKVDGSAVAGLPDDVLIEFSQVVDLLVIGDDSADEPRSGHRIARRVQDLAACPVISVPRAGGRFDAPVTIVVDDRGLERGPLSFALDWAQRHGVNVRVCQAWRVRGAVSSMSLAHHAEELDVQLADWQERYPDVGLTTLIVTADDWAARVAAASSLLVTARGAPRAVVAAAAGESPACATAVVPI